jgi:hypothetical protein
MKTTLHEAIDAWRELDPPADHPGFDSLYEAAQRGRMDDPLLHHLAACGACTRKLAELVESVDEAAGLDLALPLAAAAPAGSPLSLETACGKYVIGVYPRADDQALMTVEVKPRFTTALEGADVTVTDGAGRLLFAAPIVFGRASGRIVGVGSVDLTRLMVRAVRKEPRP